MGLAHGPERASEELAELIERFFGHVTRAFLPPVIRVG
jgi:hypothetical protein